MDGTGFELQTQVWVRALWVKLRAATGLPGRGAQEGRALRKEPQLAVLCILGPLPERKGT